MKKENQCVTNLAIAKRMIKTILSARARSCNPKICRKFIGSIKANLQELLKVQPKKFAGTPRKHQSPVAIDLLSHVPFIARLFHLRRQQLEGGAEKREG
jgi:hypothetical protein